jgi:hypothetical protein
MHSFSSNKAVRYRNTVDTRETSKRGIVVFFKNMPQVKIIREP